jgi:hypothetical protein
MMEGGQGKARKAQLVGWIPHFGSLAADGGTKIAEYSGTTGEKPLLPSGKQGRYEVVRRVSPWIREEPNGSHREGNVAKQL